MCASEEKLYINIGFLFIIIIVILSFFLFVFCSFFFFLAINGFFGSAVLFCLLHFFNNLERNMRPTGRAEQRWKSVLYGSWHCQTFAFNFVINIKVFFKNFFF